MLTLHFIVKERLPEEVTFKLRPGGGSGSEQPAEERDGGGRSRARSLGLKCGKDQGEEEILEKEAGLA